MNWQASSGWSGLSLIASSEIIAAMPTLSIELFDEEYLLIEHFPLSVLAPAVAHST
jgi:hypothetical protein